MLQLAAALSAVCGKYTKLRDSIEQLLQQHLQTFEFGGKISLTQAR
jgi:hypothetical protein